LNNLFFSGNTRNKSIEKKRGISMKKNGTGIRAVCTLCVAICWWCLLYPEFAMTPDTYRVVSEEEWEAEEDIYFQLLEQGEGKIRFRSKLLEQIELWLSRVRT
jgi:hypothetical protein